MGKKESKQDTRKIRMGERKRGRVEENEQSKKGRN